MKLSTLILASLMSLTSVAAFAEGGSERSKQFYDNFNLVQQQTHGMNEQTASADGISAKTFTVEQKSSEPLPKG